MFITENALTKILVKYQKIIFKSKNINLDASIFKRQSEMLYPPAKQPHRLNPKTLCGEEGVDSRVGYPKPPLVVCVGLGRRG